MGQQHGRMQVPGLGGKSQFRQGLTLGPLLLGRGRAMWVCSSSLRAGAPVSAPSLFILSIAAILVKGITIAWYPRLESPVTFVMCPLAHNE